MRPRQVDLPQDHTAPNSELALTHHTAEPLSPSSFRHEKARGKTERCLMWQERLQGRLTLSRGLASTGRGREWGSWSVPAGKTRAQGKGGWPSFGWRPA